MRKEDAEFYEEAVVEEEVDEHANDMTFEDYMKAKKEKSAHLKKATAVIPVASKKTKENVEESKVVNEHFTTIVTEVSSMELYNAGSTKLEDNVLLGF